MDKFEIFKRTNYEKFAEYDTKILNLERRGDANSVFEKCK